MVYCDIVQDEIPNPSPNFLINQTNANDFSVPARGVTNDELPRPPVINRREIHQHILLTYLVSHFILDYFLIAFTLLCSYILL